ncbi:hypothetical protein Tco_1376315 [Tanacetum coccineum]
MGKALFKLNGRSCGGKGGREGSMTGRGSGWLAKHLIVSKRVMAVTGRILVGLLAKVVATQWESNEEPIGSRWEERIVVIAKISRENLKRMDECVFGFEVNLYGLLAKDRTEPSFINEGSQLFVVDSKQRYLDKVKAMQRDD